MRTAAILRELRRRRVYQVTAAYAVVAWLVVQVASVTFPALQIPAWGLRLIVLLVLLGFPLALVLAWTLDITPAGVIQLTSDHTNQAATRVKNRSAHQPTRTRPETRSPSSPATLPSAEQRRPYVAVLPFANLSPDPENAFFADGLTEEVITDLAGLAGLRVISRTSVLRFMRVEQDLRSVGRELGAQFVLRGSVRRSGNSLRVTAQLIDTETESHLWADKYSGDVADIFSVQEEISRKIVSALQVRITDSEERQLSERPFTEVMAFDCYLRARQELYAWTPASLERAAALVDDALAIDAKNPLLLATKGQILWMHVNVQIRSDPELLDQADACAAAALALQPDHAHGVFVRGLVAGLRGHVKDSLRDLRHAYSARPNDANVLGELCRFENSVGSRDANNHIEELIRIDPLTPVTWLAVAFHHFQQGRVQEAVSPARRTVDMGSQPSPLHIFAGVIFAMAGLREAGIELLERTGNSLVGTIHGSWALFLKHALEGDERGAVTHATAELKRGAALVEWAAWTLATGYALLGRTADAVEWTRIAIDRGLVNYPFLAEYHPLFSNIREDPSFEALMADLRPRWEELTRNG